MKYLALFLLSISFSIPQLAVAADPPILHLKFDDGTGTAPIDSSANNVTTSFTATQPTWSETVAPVAFSNPYSLDFTGLNDGVNVAWPTELDFASTDPRTFSFWYRPTANGEGQYSRIISWSNDRLEIAGTEAGPTTHKITYFDGNWHATDITLTLNTWYHVTFTYDGTTAKFYIGDELQDEHPLAGRSLSGTLMIGNRVQDGNEGINGQIDDVRIYDYALNETQVANLAAGSNDPDSAPDTTPPIISSLTANSITSSGATITWTTDDPSSTKVIYSIDTSYGNSTSETNTVTRVTSHSTNLTGLLACTTYNYKAVSVNAASGSTTSSASSFTTTGCASRSSSGSIVAKFVCKDASALNYSNFGRHNQDLCKYQTVSTLLITPIASPVSIVRNLFYGVSGEDVKKLQSVLIGEGFTIPAGVTGFFYSQTQSALREFQKKHGITPSIGYFGPITREKMKSLNINGLWW